MMQTKRSIQFSMAILLALNLSVQAQTLYIGANYHPHDDKDMDKIQADIDLMKVAGFNVVLMGHLAWDSYEPSEGQFDLDWFDQVMDRMNDVFGIRLGSFEETEAMNEISRKSYRGKRLEVTYRGKAINTESTRFDIVDAKGAEVLGRIISLDKDYPIITSNPYGKGRTIYVGLPAKGEVLGPYEPEFIEVQ